MARPKKTDAEKVKETVDKGVEAQKVDAPNTSEVVEAQKSGSVEVVSDAKVDEAGEVQVEKSTVTVEDGEVKSVEPVRVEETPVREAHHLDVAETNVNTRLEKAQSEETPKAEDAQPEEIDKAALKQAIEDMRANEEELAQLRESQQAPTQEPVAPKTQLKKNRGRDVHGTGLKSDRTFYFGGPHSRRR